MTAVDVIARVLFDEGGADERVRAYEIADVMVAAIRSMPVEDQAELIGGWMATGDAIPSGYHAVLVKR